MASREELAHLAADWDAQAAEMERSRRSGVRGAERALTLRECARNLRDLIGIPQVRTEQ